MVRDPSTLSQDDSNKHNKPTTTYPGWYEILRLCLRRTTKGITTSRNHSRIGRDPSTLSQDDSIRHKTSHNLSGPGGDPSILSQDDSKRHKASLNLSGPGPDPSTLSQDDSKRDNKPTTTYPVQGEILRLCLRMAAKGTTTRHNLSGPGQGPSVLWQDGSKRDNNQPQPNWSGARTFDFVAGWQQKAQQPVATCGAVTPGLLQGTTRAPDSRSFSTWSMRALISSGVYSW